MGGKSAPRVACGANYPSQERAISPAARTTLFTRVVQFCPRTGGRVEVEGERAAICRAIGEAESRREGEGGEEEERKIEDSERRSQQQQQKAAHIAGIYVIYTPKKATGAGSEQQAARRKAQGASARPCASARQPKRSKAPKTKDQRPKPKSAKAIIQEQKAKSKRSWLIY
jgi:hypothetical protein